MSFIALLMVCKLWFDLFAVDAGDTPPDDLVVKTLINCRGRIITYCSNKNTICNLENLFKYEKHNLHNSFWHPKISLNIMWKIIFRIHSNFGKHFTCYSKMWSENFSAVREIFFFQKGDLHNSFGRIDVLGGLALLQRVDSSKPAHATRRNTTHHTTPFIACSSLLKKGCLNALESGCYTGGFGQQSWRAI